MYLLDTDVVCELRKGKKADPNVILWAQTLPAVSLYLSAISILELQIGIVLMERRDRNQGELLRAWMDGRVLATFQGRILAMDVAVAERCAALLVPEPGSDRDALIAATALAHGMTVVTRNVRHFQPMGVVVLNPWEAEPPVPTVGI